MGKDGPLLSELLADGRASYEELAERVGTSRQTVWRRVQKMVGSLVWGFTAVLDHRRVGWRHYILIIPGSASHDAIARVQEAEAAVGNLRTVRLLQTLLVRGDQWRLFIQVAARDALSLEGFLQALRDRDLGGGAPLRPEEVEYVLRDGGFRNPRRETLAGPRQGGPA